MSKEHPSCEVLEELATGGMPGGSASRAREHVAGCRECGSWIETYQLLSEGLKSATDTTEHPSSEELARYAAEPERLGSSERQRLHDHALSCPDCRKHLSTVTQAIAAAKESSGKAFSVRAFASPVRLALAASLLLLLGFAWALRPVPSHTEIAIAEEVSGESFHVPRLLEATDSITAVAVTAEEVSGESFRGTHLVEAIHSITADAVTVESGGDVTFRAGESVVLSNGFAVGNGAVFQVEITPANKPASG